MASLKEIMALAEGKKSTTAPKKQCKKGVSLLKDNLTIDALNAIKEMVESNSLNKTETDELMDSIEVIFNNLLEEASDYDFDEDEMYIDDADEDSDEYADVPDYSCTNEECMWEGNEDELEDEMCPECGSEVEEYEITPPEYNCTNEECMWDGNRDELEDGMCPECGSEVEETDYDEVADYVDGEWDEEDDYSEDEDLEESLTIINDDETPLAGKINSKHASIISAMSKFGAESLGGSESLLSRKKANYDAARESATKELSKKKTFYKDYLDFLDDYLYTTRSDADNFGPEINESVLNKTASADRKASKMYKKSAAGKKSMKLNAKKRAKYATKISRCSEKGKTFSFKAMTCVKSNKRR